MFASGGARRDETPRGGPTSGAPFLLPIELNVKPDDVASRLRRPRT